jgi:hypothetical protein
LSYPGVAPKHTHGLDVRAVVVRSVYQYLLKDSVYIIEIAVYREWGGYSTTGEPRILSSVSMFHPVWDYQMSSIENTTGERKWDPALLFRRRSEWRRNSEVYGRCGIYSAPTKWCS